jgi:hypothetical protein
MATSKQSAKINPRAFEQQYKQATRHAKQKERTELRARSARYDARTKRLVIELTNGLKFEMPVKLLKEFVGARTQDIAAVELLPRGAALHWDKLHIDFGVGGLLTAALGTRALMAEAGRRGTRSQLKAKTAAARANRARGGRPRKSVSA